MGFSGTRILLCRILFLRVSYGGFRKLGAPYFGVLMIRILLFRVLYWGPLFSETPILGALGTWSLRDTKASYRIRILQGERGVYIEGFRLWACIEKLRFHIGECCKVGIPHMSSYFWGVLMLKVPHKAPQDF